MANFAIPLAMAGLSALGGLFGTKKQTSDTTSNSTTTPNYDSQSLYLKNQLLGNYSDILKNLPQWNSAYETGGLKNIAAAAQNSGQAAQDILAQRGIARTTAGAGSLVDQSQQQGRNVSSFLTNAPIVENTNALNTYGGAGSFLASLPVGTTTSGSSHTVGTGGPTSPIAGLLGGGVQGLAGVLGQQSANNSLASILKNLGLNSNGTGSVTNSDASGTHPDYWED